jgi:hypothetical protein
MFQLRAVHFAANDPTAGSTRFLQATEFMREFWRRSTISVEELFDEVASQLVP